MEVIKSGKKQIKKAKQKRRNQFKNEN